MRSETLFTPKVRLELDSIFQHSRYFTGESTGRRFSVSKQSIYNFLDLRARYQHSKWKMEIELALNNLGNLTEYRSVLVSDNRVSVSIYALRGRNIRLFLRFNL